MKHGKSYFHRIFYAQNFLSYSNITITDTHITSYSYLTTVKLRIKLVLITFIITHTYMLRCIMMRKMLTSHIHVRETHKFVLYLWWAKNVKKKSIVIIIVITKWMTFEITLREKVHITVPVIFIIISDKRVWSRMKWKTKKVSICPLSQMMWLSYVLLFFFCVCIAYVNKSLIIF